MNPTDIKGKDDLIKYLRLVTKEQSDIIKKQSEIIDKLYKAIGELIYDDSNKEKKKDDSWKKTREYCS